MKFKRYISPQFVSALNELYKSEAGRSWRALLGDPDIFLAIRDNAIKAFYRGCTLATLRLDAGEVRARTHYRYLLRPSSRSPYIDSRFGRFQPSWQYDGVVEDVSDTDKLKRAARPYSGANKKLAGRIAPHNANIFDTEIALTTRAETDDRSSRRLDLAALTGDGGACELVFYCVRKLASPDLEESGGKFPVVEQLAKLERRLQKHSGDLTSAFAQEATILAALDRISPRRKEAASKIIAAGAAFRISTKPILIVGGTEFGQKGKARAKRRLVELKQAIGEARLIWAENAGGFRN